MVMSEQVVENELIPEEIQVKLERSLSYWDSVQSVTVSSQAEYDSTFEICKNLKSGFNVLEKYRKELVQPHNEKVKTINAQFKAVQDILANGEKQLKRAMTTYHTQEQLRIQAENRRIAAEAEAKRQAEMERARKEMEKANAYREQGREDLAEKAEVRAEARAEVAETIVAEVVMPTTKKSGSSFTEKFKVEIVDKFEFVREAANNSMFMGYIEIDIKALEKIANATKGQMQFPGCRITKELQMGIRTK
jgi:regulator of protease activity HflC (stomatin/prohibitin superfamily)